MRRTPPIALTIAGSDSGGGAGIQADLKTFHQFRVFGTSVVTAITAQNTQGVTDVHPVPVETVQAQIDAIGSDLPPAACKTGMLGTAELVEVVVDGIARHGFPKLVVDPVMVATSGDRLLDSDAESALRDDLLPHAALVTPNLHEASILVGFEVGTFDSMRDAARALVDLGPRAALVKGGHLDGDAVDLFWDGTSERVWRRTRIDTVHTHGTGCTLSAAAAAGLALGRTLPDATEAAVRFVARAIRGAPGLGGGHGPVDHFADVD